MTHSAFVYGTLMSPAVLRRVIHGPQLPHSTTRTLPAALTFTPAVLAGFERHRVVGADYPGIVPAAAAGACVRGALVAGLTDGDVFRLDIFEGDEYARRRVAVRPIVGGSGGEAGGDGGEELGEEREVETYVWIGPREALADEEWDYDEFVREKMWRWAGTGAETEGEFSELDGAVAVEEEKEDPTRGRGMNGAVSKVLEDEKARKEVLESAV